MRKRSYKRELMDLGPSYYSQKEYQDCLLKIGRIGALFGGDAASLDAFKKLPSVPTSILDVGCGNGAFALKLAQQYPKARVVGIDIASDAITNAYAYKNWYEEKHHTKIVNLTFEHRINAQLNEPAQSFDVVTATLLCHHLTDSQLINFLKAAKTISRQAIIINDLHRHPIAYAAFWCIAPFFNNRLITHDGLLSIQRAFKRRELKKFLHLSGFQKTSFSIKWKWAFRWVVTAHLS